MDSNKSNKSRRRGTQQTYSTTEAPLRLSALPRFHPATYYLNSSNASSLSTTADEFGSTSSGGPTPRHGNPPPLSPSTQQRVFEAQRQLSYYQQHIIAQYAGRDAALNANSFQEPDGPKLAPTTSNPGPVTPLELENRDDYLDSSLGIGANGKSSSKSSTASADTLREDGKRRSVGDGSPRRKA